MAKPPEVVELTAHAIDRFNERIRPTLTPEQAEDELCRLLSEFGHWADGPPHWRLPSDYYPRDAHWLMLGDDIAFPVEGEWAVTCLARGGWPRPRLNIRNGTGKGRQAERALGERLATKREGRAAKGNRTAERRWEGE